MSLSFVLSLVENDVLSSDQFVELTIARESARLPLAHLALRSNWLTARQVRLILDECELTNRSFAEVALANQWLGQAELNDLIARQEVCLPQWKDWLVACGVLCAGQIEALSAVFGSNAPSERLFSPPRPKFSRERVAEPLAVR